MCNCVAVWQSITARDSKSFTTKVIARSDRMTKVFFPKQVLVWIDENRGVGADNRSCTILCWKLYLKRGVSDLKER